MNMLNTGGLTSAMKALLKGESEKPEANELEKKNELIHGNVNEELAKTTEDAKKNTSIKMSFGELRSKKTTAFRRTKNPVILNLLIVSQVKKILKKGLEETKNDNKLGEKKWEILSTKQSKNYESGGSNQGYLTWATMGGFALTAMGSNLVPKDKKFAGFNVSKVCTQGGNLVKTLSEGAAGQIQQEVAKNHATLDMGSQAASAKFQSDTQKEGSDQGLIDQANQLLQELMRLSSGFFTRGFQG